MTGYTSPPRRFMAAALAWGLAFVIHAAEGERMQTRRFSDNGAELTNPGMGWALHYYDNVPKNYGSRLAPSDLLPDWPGLSFIYLRIPWSYIEPEEGVFNWSVVDTPMQRFRPRGLQACFRFSCSESWMEYATPEWVRKAGAKGYRFRPGRGITPDGPFWEPDFDDPVFMAKLEAFLTAAAHRYDGHPDVAFIDIGSFGVWGEGHTWASTRKAYPNATIRRHIDLHTKLFSETRIVGMDDFLSRPTPQTPLTDGVNERAFDVQLPMAWRGRSFTVAAGLWRPRRKQHNGRLLPMHGQDDRRVVLGVLHIADDGRTRFEPARPQLPNALTDGAEFAIACAGIRHDYDVQPHSLKVPVRLLAAGAYAAGCQPFLHFLDPATGAQVCVFREEKEDAELTRYMSERGLGIRDDSILVSGTGSGYFHAEMGQQFWPQAPAVIESQHYGGSVARGHWGDGSGFLQAIEDYHASYASIHWWPHEFLEKNRTLVRQINLRIGYRFRLTEFSWRDAITMTDTFSVAWTWRNAGVAPPYVDYFPTVTLKDKQGGVAAVWVDDSRNLRRLPVSLHSPPAIRSEREFRLPYGLGAGEYTVHVSVGDRLGRPIVALPLDGGDGARRYAAGTCRITGDYAITAVSGTITDSVLALQAEWLLRPTVDAGVTPFVHADVAGKSAWTGGLPDDHPQRAEFAQAGSVATSFSVQLPQIPAGGSCTIFAGLWRPEHMGRSDERLIPDRGEQDRRVRLGQVTRDRSGTLIFTPTSSD